MYLNIDTYEHLLTFLDDKTVLNALSVNSLFRSETFFERVLRKRYPYTMRFKDKEMNWINYFIQTIYYLNKLAEKNIPYLPVHDFNAKDIYRDVISGKLERIMDFMYCETDIERLIKKCENNYHSIATFSETENKFVVAPNFIRGASASYLCLTNKSYDDEIIIDINEYMLNKLTQRENIWLAFITTSQINTDIHSYGKIFDTKEEAIFDLEREREDLKDEIFEDNMEILRDTGEILEIRFKCEIFTSVFQTVKINLTK